MDILQFVNPDIYLPIVQLGAKYSKKESFESDPDKIFSMVYSASNYLRLLIVLILIGFTWYKINKNEVDDNVYIDISATVLKFLILLVVVIVEIYILASDK